jgi:hypothetical protein
MSEPLVAMALYRPFPGKEEELWEILRHHFPTLQREGLVTEQELLTLQASDGTIIEIFEWCSEEAKEKAHASAAVMEIWNKMMTVAEMTSLSTLPEAQRPFPNFKRM